VRIFDLDSNLGEAFGPWSTGEEAAMLNLVTNVAGGHVGDHETMFAVDLIGRSR
jgi:5-oxoprolinase (ATP-hydrolysing) subunit A